MKIKLKEFIGKDGKKRDQVFEIQEMDLGIYYDLTTALTMGHITLSQLAEPVLKDCIVSPEEAKKIDYFENHPKALDTILGQIRGLLGEGVTKAPQVEIIE